MTVVMGVRCLRRALRFVPPLLSSQQHASAPCGLDIIGKPSYVLGSSSAPLPAIPKAFLRPLSSADVPPRTKKSEDLDVHGYNRLISAMDYKKRYHLGRVIYEDMQVDGVQPIHETFYLLINASMKASRLQDVMYFFEEMKTMGLSPDVACFNCIIAACGRCLQVDKAFQVGEEMEAYGLQLRHRTYLLLLRTCAIAGRVDEAYLVIQKMTASGLSLDKNFYSALILALRNKKPPTEDATQKIFEALEQSKQQLPEDLMVLAATGESEVDDDIDDGLAHLLADDMQPRRGFLNRRLTVYHAAVKSLSLLGKTEAVKEVLKMVEMDGHEPDSYCIIQLIKCYLAEKDFEQACAAYSNYVDKGQQPSLELYVLLIEGALDNYSSASSAIAEKLLADLARKGYFLNGQIGSQLMKRACKEHVNDIVIGNLIWDNMKKRGVTIARSTAQEYLKALERGNIPKDDPRIIDVKALVDEGHRVSFYKSRDKIPIQQSAAEQMPEQVTAEQVTEDIATSEQVTEEKASSGQ